jgi:hypothetical protein
MQERKISQARKPVQATRITPEAKKAFEALSPDEQKGLIRHLSETQANGLAQALIEYDREGKPIPAQGGTAPPCDKPHQPWEKCAERRSEAKYTIEDADGTVLSSQVDVGEIKTINWTKGKDYGVESIVTDDGQTLYPTPAPAPWLYLLIALFPVFGFFIPWGAVRAIGWVGAGFVQSAK